MARGRAPSVPDVTLHDVLATLLAWSYAAPEARELVEFLSSDDVRGAWLLQAALGAGFTTSQQYNLARLLSRLERVIPTAIAPYDVYD